MTAQGHAAKVTTDMAMGAPGQHFGSTVTVTIQLIGTTAGNDAMPAPAGRCELSRVHRTYREADTNGTATSTVTPDVSVTAGAQVNDPDAHG